MKFNKSFLLKRLYFCAVIGCFLYPTHSFGQITENSVGQFQKKYPSSNLINLKNEKTILIELDNDSILISQTILTEDLFLNKAAAQYSEESLSYSTFFELGKVEASSHNLVDGKYVESKVSDFRTKDELNGAFYDDVKSLNFIYPNLDTGSKTSLYYEEKIKNPRFVGAFYFGGYFPILNSKLTIIVDSGIDLEFKEFNVKGIAISFTKTEKRNKTVFVWETKNIDGIKMEEGTPSINNYYPHIVPMISKYQSGGKEVKLTSSVEDLYNWYYSMVKDLNASPSNDQLVALVNDLTKDKSSEIEKVKAIYYWVQNNIKYIAFEYGLGGFIPREANDIFTKKFGDCKDNSSILFEMLEIAGIKGNLTWIGTRKIPYSYNELPTPAVDNHMILTYRDHQNIYFLDATGRYIPIDLPTSFIQGKEALVGNGLNDFEIVKVPVIVADVNKSSTKAFLTIQDNILQGTAVKSLTGYQKIDIYNDLELINSSKKLNDYYVEFLRLGNNKFTLNNFEEKHKFNYDKHFNIEYNFSISDYMVKSANEIYINLNLDKKLEHYKIIDNRKTDIESDYKKTYEFENHFTIPEGYIVDYLPEDFKVKNEFMEVSISYKQLENKIVYSHLIKFNFLVLPIENQPDYNAMLKKVDKAYKEVIVLKEK